LVPIGFLGEDDAEYLRDAGVDAEDGFAFLLGLIPDVDADGHAPEDLEIEEVDSRGDGAGGEDFVDFAVGVFVEMHLAATVDGVGDEVDEGDFA
jgi:hypothetical protein